MWPDCVATISSSRIHAMSVTPPGTDTSYAWENTSGGTFSWE